MAQGSGPGSTCTVIPEINRQLQHYLKVENKLVASSFLFSKLRTNYHRVAFSHDLLQEANLLPHFSLDVKSNEKSEQLRQKGNEKFRKRQTKECHEFYTKSIAHAEPGSQHLALAYANRSAVLFEVGLYKQCLLDVEKALQLAYPEKLKPKLLARQSKAKQLQNTYSLEYQMPCPTIPLADRNPLIQSASKAVMVEYTDTVGRKVVAARDIQPGEIIVVEKPFAKNLIDQFYTHCHHCLRLCYTLIPCSECTQAMFCSQTCIIEAYEQYHQFECPLLLTIQKIDLDHRHLHFKLTILVRNRFNDIKMDKCKVSPIEVYRSDRYEEIYNLVSHTADRTLTDLFNRAIHSAALYYLLKTQTHFFVGLDEDAEHTFMGLLLHNMQVGPCNFHALNQANAKSNRQLGDGAYSFLSLFNHSCCPNVVRESYEDIIFLYAVEPIKAGQECVDNYGCHHAVMDKKERRAALKQQYFFDCACTACIKDYPLYEHLVAHPGAENHKMSNEELLILRSGHFKKTQMVFKSLLKKIEAVVGMKPDQILSELQEAVKQCYTNFTMIRTPI